MLKNNSTIKVPKVAKSLAKVLFATVFWVGVWVLISLKINNSFLFPSPLSVLSALSSLVAEPDFWKISIASLCRVLAGTVMSIVIGIILAVITTYSKIVNILASPLLSIIKATPVASFIILACVWLDRNILPVVITSLIVIPIVWSNISEGFASVDKNLLEVAKIYRFSFFKKVNRLYVPSILPYFFAACKSSLGMAWKAGIAAEILAVPQNAIGTELYYTKTYLDTPAMFAWTLVIIVLSIIFEKLFVIGIERLGKRLHAFRQKGGVENVESN